MCAQLFGSRLEEGGAPTGTFTGTLLPSRANSIDENKAGFRPEPMVLPDGFSYLRDADPSIVQDMRYAGADNFMGAVVAGYLAPRAILTTAACQALSQVQKLVQQDGYTLVVYDGYRPQKAVDYFMAWSSAPTLSAAAEAAKASYYPSLDRENLFDLGYIAARSGHSRGSTVDLTIMRIGEAVCPPTTVLLRNGLPYLPDGTVDMGSSFDLFDSMSHHDLPESQLPAQYRQPRDYLREVMGKCGFRPYEQEWWHYTLENEPFPDTYFDFDVL